MSVFDDPEIYRDILDGLQIGVSVLDLQKKIIFWSDGAEQITGYTRMEVLGHACSENILLNCNQVSCEMCSEECPMSAALRNATAVESLNFIRHKSGYRSQVHTWMIPLRNKHGSVIGVILTFEGELAVHGRDPNDRSTKQHGWLDEVTGLPNQPMMQSHLRETLGTFTELHIPFGVACLEVHDLNQFRARYGQGASRSILQVLARTLRNTVWPTDVVGTWNDNQFLVILMGCNDDELQAASRRMFRMLSSATISWWGEQLSAKVSIGCTGARPGDTLETILQRAKLATAGKQLILPEPASLARAASSSKGSAS